MIAARKAVPADVDPPVAASFVVTRVDTEV
jgi:hypothetical protein